MKKYLLSLILISVALLAIGFVSAADVDGNCSDSAAAVHEIHQTISMDIPPYISAGWDGIDTFGWNHNSRNPRGSGIELPFGPRLGSDGLTPLI